MAQPASVLAFLDERRMSGFGTKRTPLEGKERLLFSGVKADINEGAPMVTAGGSGSTADGRSSVVANVYSTGAVFVAVDFANTSLAARVMSSTHVSVEITVLSSTRW